MRDCRPHHLLSNLCLDAPLIALGWSLLLGTSSAAAPSSRSIALFLVVWSIYLADRLLDVARRPVPGTRRHLWAARHRHWLAALLALTSVTTVSLAPHLDRALWTRGGLLAGAVLVYFAVFRRWRFRSPRLPSKEIVIGLVFALGIALASGLTMEKLAWPVAAMGFLFTGNCLLIARAERGIDVDLDPAAFYAGTGRAHPLPEVCFIGTLVVAGLGFTKLEAFFAATLLLAAAASFAIARAETRGRVREVQLAADGVLMIPWIFLLAGKLLTES